MVYIQALNTYQKTAVETVDNLKLIVMCYDAILRDLEEVRRLHESNSIESSYYSKIRHVQDIVTELLVGLDYEQGGEISVNLSRLYNFILRQLIGINSRKDAGAYECLIRIVSELRGSWEQIRLSTPQATSEHLKQVERNWRASA